MTLPLRVHAATHVGLVHPNNEDSYAVGPPDEGGLLLLVCDGMGGMGRGDEASKLAVQQIQESMGGSRGLPPERMRQAIRTADEVVRAELCSGPMGNPGSTAVLVYVTDGAAHVAWVGDSRAYLIRDHRVVERTRDHKLVEELVAAGQMSQEEAKTSTLAHVVTRALGGRGPEEQAVKAGTLGHPWKLVHGDIIVLCSDGLCDLVEDDELPALVEGLAPDHATERLIEVALERGGHDNITCIVAHWEGATYQEDDVQTPVMVGDRIGIPDLRSWGGDALDPGLDPGDDGRVTEEIDRDEAQALADGGRTEGASPNGRDADTDEIESRGAPHQPRGGPPPPAPLQEGHEGQEGGGGRSPDEEDTDVGTSVDEIAAHIHEDDDSEEEAPPKPPVLEPAPMPVDGPVAPPPDPSANDVEPPATPPIIWVAAAIGGLLGLLGAAGWLFSH